MESLEMNTYKVSIKISDQYSIQKIILSFQIDSCVYA